MLIIINVDNFIINILLNLMCCLKPIVLKECITFGAVSVIIVGLASIGGNYKFY